MSIGYSGSHFIFTAIMQTFHMIFLKTNYLKFKIYKANSQSVFNRLRRSNFDKMFAKPSSINRNHQLKNNFSDFGYHFMDDIIRIQFIKSWVTRARHRKSTDKFDAMQPVYLRIYSKSTYIMKVKSGNFSSNSILQYLRSEKTK